MYTSIFVCYNICVQVNAKFLVRMFSIMNEVILDHSFLWSSCLKYICQGVLLMVYVVLGVVIGNRTHFRDALIKRRQLKQVKSMYSSNWEIQLRFASSRKMKTNHKNTCKIDIKQKKSIGLTRTWTGDLLHVKETW